MNLKLLKQIVLMYFVTIKVLRTYATITLMHERNKHIDIRLHWNRDVMSDGIVVQIKKIHTYFFLKNKQVQRILRLKNKLNKTPTPFGWLQ